MTVGTVLKQAREQTGLSAEQISERTKIQLYKIEALEEDDFSRLPEGIYLDGIIQAYSREVGINAGNDGGAGADRTRQAPRRLGSAVLGADRSPRHSRPNDRQSHRPSRIRRSAGVIRDRAPDVQCAGDATGAADVKYSARANQPISAPPPVNRQDPVIVRVPAARPHRRRGRTILALLALFAAAFSGAYFYESNRALERDEQRPPRRARRPRSKSPHKD